MSKDDLPTERTPSLTALIRRFCREECMGGATELVSACSDQACPFHEFRTSELRCPDPLRVIRRFCLRCSGGDRDSVRRCPAADCLFRPYRIGVRPSTIKAMRTRLSRPRPLPLPGMSD